MKKTHRKRAPGQQQTPRRRIGRLKTAKDVAHYIARCIKLSERGGDTEGANTYYKLCCMGSMLLKAIEVSTFEERIERLEELAEIKGDQA